MPTCTIEEAIQELRQGRMIILVDDEGNAYHAISDGIFKSLQTYCGLLGNPNTWPEPVAIIVDEKRSRRGFKFMTIKLAPASEEKSAPAKK